MTGIYLMLAELPEAAEIRVRSGRVFTLKEGFYIYVGSALNGLEKRVARHLGHRKKLFWHIDFLLNSATVRRVISAQTSRKEECAVARALDRVLPGIPGFGNSDCHCASHLFFSPDLPAAERYALRALKQRGLGPVHCHCSWSR